MEKLTPQHSLYLIANDELKEFQAFYERWQNVLPTISAKIFNDEDSLATVLNCWISIKRYPAFPIKTNDKDFSYVCNDHIHSYLIIPLTLYALYNCGKMTMIDYLFLAIT